MNMNFKNFGPMLLAAGGSAVLIAGCGTDKTPVFTDAGSIPSLSAYSAARTPVSGLSKEDGRKIELAVFRSMLTRHLWDEHGITAIFLEADDAEVTQLQGEFPGLIPPIKPSSQVDLTSRQKPMDKDTGKPAIILSVELSDVAADGSVPATGKWYSGTAATGFYSFILKKNGDDWTIQDSP